MTYHLCHNKAYSKRWLKWVKGKLIIITSNLQYLIQSRKRTTNDRLDRRTYIHAVEKFFRTIFAITLISFRSQSGASRSPQNLNFCNESAHETAITPCKQYSKQLTMGTPQPTPSAQRRRRPVVLRTSLGFLQNVISLILPCLCVSLADFRVCPDQRRRQFRCF